MLIFLLQIERLLVSATDASLDQTDSADVRSGKANNSSITSSRNGGWTAMTKKVKSDSEAHLAESPSHSSSKVTLNTCCESN